MKKILFFETYEFTGATRVTRTLAKAAKQKYIVAFAKVGDNVKEDIESAIEKENPDILFSSFIHINPEIILTGKQNSLHVIIRNDYKLEDVPESVRLQAIETYPFADEIIAQTEDMLQSMLAIPSVEPSRVRVMENPLDKEDILEKANEPNPFSDNGYYHFLWVGRKDPIKDLPTLQRAFEIVNKENPKTDLTLISDNPNPYKWMKHANCLVISSISEASPNVLREAMFLGTPIVATDCSPTVRDLLHPSSIVPIGDVSALAKAMINEYLKRKMVNG